MNLKQKKLISICSKWGVLKAPESLFTSEKLFILDRMSEDVRKCKSCNLSENRFRTDLPCMYIGNPSAKVMLLGKSPGYWELKKGTLFAGKSKGELEWMLSSSNISWDDIYVTNICHCRSQNEKPLKSKEIRSCKKWLTYQIDIVQPNIVMMMGSQAIQAMTGKKTTMNEIRGSVIEKDGLKLIATFHPAYYNHSTIEVEERNKQEGLKDWKLLRSVMDEQNKNNKN